MNKAQEELNNQMQHDAKIYVFNVMNLGNDYTDEEYNKAVEKARSDINDPELGKDYFTSFNDVQMSTNLTTMMQGYGNFGTKFINEVVDNDPASAKVLLESLAQDWLDLQNFIKNMTDKMQESLNKSEENIEGDK